MQNTKCKFTWQQLLDYINSSDVDLKSEVVLYDVSTGSEYECDITEYNEQGWIPRITFNSEDEL
jgi:hypothetical protein